MVFFCVFLKVACPDIARHLRGLGLQLFIVMGASSNSDLQSETKLWQEVLDAWHAGRLASRLELANRYTKENPERVAGWLALADAFVHLARYKEAHAALTRAQQCASEDFEHFVYVQWGHLYNESCELRKANDGTDARSKLGREHRT